LKFQAHKHGQADEAETEDTGGKADQPAEHSPLPGWVEKLLTACHWTATFNSLICWKRSQKLQFSPGVDLNTGGKPIYNDQILNLQSW